MRVKASSMSNSNWSAESWKEKPVLQDVVYEDKAHLNKVLKKLECLPPMVTPTEVNNRAQGCHTQK
jgi:3-deoxy-7-phosphoheptulonate synthase